MRTVSIKLTIKGEKIYIMRKKFHIKKKNNEYHKLIEY